MTLESYIQKLKTIEHPESEREFIRYVVMALENPNAFFSQFKPADQLQREAREAAMMVLEQYGLDTAVRYLVLHGIHESVSK